MNGGKRIQNMREGATLHPMTRMYACAYNIDHLYNTRLIDLPGIVKMVYIICVHYMYIHRKIKNFFNNNIIALSVNMYLQRLIIVL